MLIEDICKQCKWRMTHFDVCKIEFCRTGADRKILSMREIKKKTPRNCPYYLEHLLVEM